MIDSVTEEALKSTRRRRRRPTNGAPPGDRLPPHSPECEAGVLGCILLSPNETMSEAVAGFRGREVFYDSRNQTIWNGLLEMVDRNEAIDVITLQQWLKDRQLLEQVGGIAYLSSLPDAVPSAANLSYYLNFVWEKYLLRQLLRVFADSTARIYEFEGDVEELLDTVEADILKVNEGRSESELRKMPELMGKAISLVEQMHRGVGLIGGIRTHFGYFDKMTGGLHRKELAVLAGRPSLGKTSLAIGIAQNVAKFEKIPVGLFSLEMSAEDIALRLWHAEAEADFHKTRTGFISNEAIERLTGSVQRASRLALFIDDTSALSILELRAKARRMAQQFGVKLFVIDYLQLMHSTNKRAQNREQEIADISSGLKAMAKELDAPVIVLSQLNREAEKRKYIKPQLSDLRESGAIEQDADLVGILYQPKKDNEEDEDGNEITTNLHIAKQRNGPTGDVEFLFKRWCMKFVDAYGNRGALPNQEKGISAVS